jgi:type I restriction enzyme, S subunit
VKAGWEVKPLGEVCELVNGKAYKKAELLDQGKYPVLRVGNFFTSTKWFFSDLELEPKKYCHNGDLLYAWSASFGPRIWEGEKSIFHYHIWNVQHPDNLLDRKFLYYYFDWDKEKIKEEQGAGATMIHVSKGSMEARALPIPPLKEQKRIVAVLDAAFEGLTRAKENAETNLQNARELFESRVSTEFGRLGKDFGTRPIGDIAEHRLGKMLDKNKNRGAPRRYLRNKNVQWFEIDTSDLLEMRIEEAEIAKYSVENGDLLICEGGYPGRAAIWTEADPIFYQKALHRVRFAEPVYNHLLLYWLYILDQTGQLAVHCSGAGIQHFTGKSLARFEMPYPTTGVAAEAVEAIEGTKQQSEELEVNYQTKLTDIADLRQSLLQKAFAGELT